MGVENNGGALRLFHILFCLVVLGGVVQGNCSNSLSGKTPKITHWGVVIPGLAMRADEMPKIPGLLALENPELAGAGHLRDGYELEDIAERHAKYIHERPELFGTELKVIGMSMGGMVLSIMASKFRSLLPEKCQFYFFVTSANSAFAQAIPESLEAKWKSVTLKEFESFRSILAPLFGKSFAEKHPEKIDGYVRYRMAGGNEQTAKGFMRQLAAIKRFHGEDFYPLINPQEAFFVGGTDDTLFGPEHNNQLEFLVPDAKHQEIRDLGHMINLERPDLFDLR